MDKCPACDRKFKGIFDYPKVYVAKFQRVGIPEDLVLPSHDGAVYVGPKRRVQNPRPPEEVLEYFRKNLEETQFKNKGETWHLEGEWDDGHYHRSIDNSRDMILSVLDPYFDKLEGLVGKEVSTDELVVKDLGRYGRILDTSYDLAFNDLESHEKEIFGLPVPDLETEQPTKKVAFAITRNSGGSISMVHYLACVGGLAYEGRINK